MKMACTHVQQRSRNNAAATTQQQQRSSSSNNNSRCHNFEVLHEFHIFVSVCVVK